MVGDDAIVSQAYHFTNATGEPTTFPLPDGYPLQNCTTCDTGMPTDYCDNEDERCFRISDTGISIVAGTNGSLLYSSPYSLGSGCTPRYLHQLDKDKYGIICHESSYRLFYIEEDGGGPVLSELSHAVGSGGILVQTTRDFETYTIHVEIKSGYILTHEIESSTNGFFPEDGYEGCAPHSLSLQPTFASGLFFLHCTTDAGERHFLCRQRCTEVDICSNPLPSPPSTTGGRNTFVAVCGDTLTVYDTNDVTQNYSASFGCNISSHSYLDKDTLLIETESEQHFVTVDTFFNSHGSAGVTTLENTDVCSLHKLLTPDIYATVCRNGLLYSVRIFATASGQELGPIQNLEHQPWDVYFEKQEPPVPSPTPTPTPPSPETTDTTNYHTTDAPSPHETLTPNSTTTAPPKTTSSVTPTNSTNSANPVTIPVSVKVALAIAAVVVAIVVLVLVSLLVLLFRCRSRRKEKFPTQVEDREPPEYNPVTSSLSSSGSSRHSSTISV